MFLIDTSGLTPFFNVRFLAWKAAHGHDDVSLVRAQRKKDNRKRIWLAIELLHINPGRTFSLWVVYPYLIWMLHSLLCGRKMLCSRPAVVQDVLSKAICCASNNRLLILHIETVNALDANSRQMEEMVVEY